MLTSLIIRIVDASRRYAALVIAASLLMTLGLGWYTATHLTINTDVNQLLSEDLPWRQQEKALEKAFPQKVDNLVIVIDGATPDEAENAAAKLADRLRTLPQQFTFVERPDAIPFFRKNGLLFLSKEELSATLDQLIQAQPLLGMLATDPSLRGLASMLDLMAQGYRSGQTDYNRLDAPIAKIAETMEAALEGRDRPLALQSLAGGNVSPRDLRKFIITKPVLDYSALESGKAARDTIRKLVDELHLTSNQGVRVRMTGSVALNDEEFASVASGTGFATLLSGILVLTLLLLGLRSLRIIVPILLTLATGLVATSAFALAVVGSLNMISVAFAVMFIGIAVDFGIQFGIRYRDQHHKEPSHGMALAQTASAIATPLTMAAASTALGFMAFIPTAYRGVSELGLIAGAGMVIAYILNLTLFPALLTIARPRPEREAVGFAWAAPLDSFILIHRRMILIVALAIGIVGLGVATQLPFDFDPLNLKDPKTESVSTMFDVMKDPDSGFYAIEVLRPSLQQAKALAEQTAKLPEVDHAMTLASFVPDEQTAKLAMIADARMLLDPTLAMEPIPAPAPQENVTTLQKLAADLHIIGKGHSSAQRLAIAIDDVLERHDEKLMERLDNNLITVMQVNLGAAKDLLNAAPVTVDSITDDLRHDWVTADGRYRVQIHPKGNPRDHDTLLAFTKAVRASVPDAAGTPISIQESGKTITTAFLQAGIYALIAIAILAFFILRSVRDVLILLTPLILAGILTLATIVAIGLSLNFANIIALPLLLSLGVSYAIYFVSYARSGYHYPLQSSMARAVLFSAATVLVAFGSLALSLHPGTASMGDLLTVALVYSLLFTIFVLPALLASTKPDKP